MKMLEERVLAAAKHVERATKQQELFNLKKQEAKDDKEKHRGARSYCFVADFAQNMNLPNFSAEQPGSTYYYSPMSVYPFGIVDSSTAPSELTAYCYYEGMLPVACRCCIFSRVPNIRSSSLSLSRRSKERRQQCCFDALEIHIGSRVVGWTRIFQRS